MSFKPQDIVAVVLSVSILAFIILGVLEHKNDIVTDNELSLANIWGDLIQVIVGGLIGYIMTKDGGKN